MLLKKHQVEKIIYDHIKDFKYKLIYVGNKTNNFINKKNSNKPLLISNNTHLLLLDVNYMIVKPGYSNGFFIKIVLDVLYEESKSIYVFSTIIFNKTGVTKNDIIEFINSHIRLV